MFGAQHAAQRNFRIVQRHHLTANRARGCWRTQTFDLSACGTGGKHYIPRGKRNRFGSLDAGAAVSFAKQTRDSGVGVQLDAGRGRRYKYRFCKRAIVDRLFIRQQGGGARFPSDCGFEFVRFVEGQGLGGEAEAVMQCNEGAQLARSASAEKRSSMAPSRR